MKRLAVLILLMALLLSSCGGRKETHTTDSGITYTVAAETSSSPAPPISRAVHDNASESDDSIGYVFSTGDRVVYLDDMTMQEILRLVRDKCGDYELFEYLREMAPAYSYWSHEDVCDVYAYAYQKGFLDALNGRVGPMTEEYVYGYEFSESDAAKYDAIFE